MTAPDPTPDPALLLVAALAMVVACAGCGTANGRETARAPRTLFPAASRDAAPEHPVRAPETDDTVLPARILHVRREDDRSRERMEQGTGAGGVGVAYVFLGDHDRQHPALRPNVVTDFSPEISAPRVDPTSYVDPAAVVVGAVEIGARTYVAPLASMRGDEGQPLHVGDESNVQDGVVIHALETIANGRGLRENVWRVGDAHYAVYVGNRVSLAHQAQVHGPAWIEDDVMVGLKALVFRAHVGRGVVIEPAANVIGVTIAPGRYVPAGMTVTDQSAADALPLITERYALRDANAAAVRVHTSLVEALARDTAAPAAAVARLPARTVSPACPISRTPRECGSR